MSILSVFQNHVLIAAIVAWGIAQIVKLPVEFASTRVWNWSLLLRAGGMPSSHAALVTAAAHGIGLTAGFDSGLYALSIVLAMIVIYDATGIRRQAGRHAEIINTMIQGLVEGHPLHQEQLMEVLGHSPFQALVGMLLGLVVAQVLVGWVW